MPNDTPVAFVTGASRGIGRCGALALAKAGYDVVLTARTLHEGEAHVVSSSSADEGREIPIPGSLETTAAEIEALGRRALPIRMDLMDRASIGMAYANAMNAWGRIDVLYNNAVYQGPGSGDRILDLSLENALNLITGDYLNQLLLIQLVLPQMIERKHGYIINMTSATAYTDPPAPAGEGGWGAGYAASKAAFHRLTPVLHVEYFRSGIRTFSVDPGFVITERMKATATNEAFEAVGFRGSPPEVPGAVVGWLASAPEADEHSGKIVVAYKVCKAHGLIPGWPPPRSAG